MYDNCPASFKYKHLDKLPDPPSPAMARGDAIHKSAAAYISGTTPQLAPELERFAPLMSELRALPDKVVEQQWGFTAKWRSTGWFGKDTWLRVILDAGVVYPDGTADVVDHKTGKRYGSNDDQMELFGLVTMCRFPSVRHVTTRLWYIDTGDEEVAEFTADDAEKLKAKWEQRVKPMFTDTVFAPRPNDKCRWCAFSRSKNGPCKFG